MRKSKRIAQLEAKNVALRDALDWWIARSIEANLRDAAEGRTYPLDPNCLLQELDEAEPSAGAKAYDRDQILRNTGATPSEAASCPDRSPAGKPKKWFTHPTNPTLDGWY